MTTPDGSSSAKQPPPRIAVELPITVGQFVKAAGLAVTGGEAKQLVTAGLVKVNGQIDERRGHKLVPGDIVEVRGMAAEVALKRPPSPQG
jgi:ribosome-associated protein